MDLCRTMRVTLKSLPNAEFYVKPAQFDRMRRRIKTAMSLRDLYAEMSSLAHEVYVNDILVKSRTVTPRFFASPFKGELLVHPRS